MSARHVRAKLVGSANAESGDAESIRQFWVHFSLTRIQPLGSRLLQPLAFRLFQPLASRLWPRQLACPTTLASLVSLP